VPRDPLNASIGALIDQSAHAALELEQVPGIAEAFASIYEDAAQLAADLRAARALAVEAQLRREVAKRDLAVSRRRAADLVQASQRWFVSLRSVLGLAGNDADTVAARDRVLATLPRWRSRFVTLREGLGRTVRALRSEVALLQRHAASRAAFEAGEALAVRAEALAARLEAQEQVALRTTAGQAAAREDLIVLLRRFKLTWRAAAQATPGLRPRPDLWLLSAPRRADGAVAGLPLDDADPPDDAPDADVPPPALDPSAPTELCVAPPGDAPLTVEIVARVTASAPHRHG
jgi:hypothetical protein